MLNMVVEVFCETVWTRSQNTVKNCELSVTAIDPVIHMYFITVFYKTYSPYF